MRTLHEGKDQNKKSTVVAVKQKKPLPKKRVECMPIMFQSSDEDDDDGEFMGFSLEEVREVGLTNILTVTATSDVVLYSIIYMYMYNNMFIQYICMSL